MKRHATRLWCDQRRKWCNHRLDPVWCKLSPLCSLSQSQIEGLVRIRENPLRWSAGGRRTGGAIARMFKRLAEAGFCTVWPPKITEAGLKALELHRR